MFNLLIAQSDTLLGRLQEMLSFKHVRWDDYLTAVNETLYMTIVATIIVAFVGLALGLLLFLTSEGNVMENKIIYQVISQIVNIFRSIPFIILIVLLIPFTILIAKTMIGPNGALPALIISAAPFYARLVEIALKEIPKGIIEAAESMGASTWRIIVKVLIPESLPALISGLTVTAIALISSTAVAAVIGAGGLGGLAYLVGYTRNQIDVTFLATISILVLVFIFQIIGDLLTKRVDKR